MKLRIYPKKTVLIGLLQADKEVCQKNISETETKLAELSAPGKIYNPYTQSEKFLKDAILGYQQTIAGIETKLALLESHDPPEVMVELDI